MSRDEEFMENKACHKGELAVWDLFVFSSGTLMHWQDASGRQGRLCTEETRHSSLILA